MWRKSTLLLVLLLGFSACTIERLRNENENQDTTPILHDNPASLVVVYKALIEANSQYYMASYNQSQEIIGLELISENAVKNRPYRNMNGWLYSQNDVGTIYAYDLETQKSLIYDPEEGNQELSPWCLSEYYLYQAVNTESKTTLLQTSINSVKEAEMTPVWSIDTYTIDYLYSEKGMLYVFVTRTVNGSIDYVLHMLDEETLEEIEVVDFSWVGHSLQAVENVEGMLYLSFKFDHLG